MSIDVFNRFEKKYILDQATYETVYGILKERMTLDPYNKEDGFYTISNIYYDTKEDELIKKSLSKPIYKEKLRLRAYGVPKMDTKVFLEIKKKYKGLVNKRRSTLMLNEAYDFIQTQIMPEPKIYQNRQVLKELDFFLKQYRLVPSMYIAYDRIALHSEDLRITFDTHIRARTYDLSLEQGDYGTPVLKEGEWLMEVKAHHALPLWFVRVLSDYHIYSTSFSKYGKAYMMHDVMFLKGEKVS